MMTGRHDSLTRDVHRRAIKDALGLLDDFNRESWPKHLWDGPKEKKLLKTITFPEVLENSVDFKKVKLESMKPWIEKRVTEDLGFEDLGFNVEDPGLRRTSQG